MLQIVFTRTALGNSKVNIMVDKESRRKPTQERSKKRVDAILNAAKSLIAEKGSAQLKIHEIAERAEVTPASIYQYFPSKNAITLALAQNTFDNNFSNLSESLPSMTTKEESCKVLQGIIEEYYQAYLNDPAMMDIWVSVSADKSMDSLDLEDSRRHAALICDCIKHFYDQKFWGEISRISFLLSHMSGSVVRMAISVGEDEGRTLVNSFKKLINPASIDSMLFSEVDG